MVTRFPFGLLVGPVLASVASAQVSYTVCPEGCDFPDVQSAVDAIPLSESGTVLVATGTYEGGVVVDGRTVEIRAEDGAEVILDGGGVGRVLHLVDGADATVVGLVLENGLSSESGGGVRAETGTTITLQRCEIRHCVSGADGGGVSVAPQVFATIEDCTFYANNAEGESSNGGGLHLGWIDGGTIDRCRFESNRATLEGGAIHQTRSGGQFRVVGPYPQIRNCLFFLNEAGGSVAWIEPALEGCEDPSVVGYMTNCTFFQNQPEEGVCLTGSSDDWCGGSEAAGDLRLRVFNTVVDNSGDRFPGFEIDDYRYCHLDFLTGQENNSILGADRGPVFIFETEGDQKTYFDPRVLPQSGMIDAGSTLLPGGFTIDPGPFDLLGTARVIDDPDSPDLLGGSLDIGASEYDPAIMDGLPEAPGLDFSIWNGDGDGQSFTDPANWSGSKIADSESIWLGYYDQPTDVHLPPNGKNGASIVLGSLGIYGGRLNLHSPEGGDALVRIPANPRLPFTSGLYVGIDGPAILDLDEGITLECEFIRSERARIRLNGATVRVDTLVQIEPSRDDVSGPDGLRVATIHGPGIVERPGAPVGGEGFDPLVVNEGRIRVDELLTIRGDYLQETGELKFRSRAGDDTGNLDRRVVIEGRASMGGTLVFDVGMAGWQPAVGSCFEIVHATEGFVPGEETFDFVVTRWSGDDQNRFFVVSNTPCGSLGPGTGESIYATVVSLDDLLSQSESLQSAGVQLQDMLLVDLDGDGYEDLVLSIDVGTSAGQVVVLRNQGVSSGDWQGFEDFAGGGTVASATVGVGPRGLDAGYFDAGSTEGGNLDLVVANEGDGTVSVISNDGLGPGDLALSVLQTIDLVGGPQGDGTNPLPIDLCALNYDLDPCGLSDLAVTCRDNSIWTLQNLLSCDGAHFVEDPLGNTVRSSQSTPRPITELLPGLGGGTGGGKRNDSPDGTSDEDDSVNNGEVVLPATGVGFTLSWTSYPTIGGGRPVDLAKGDLNGDGFDDLVAVNFEDDSFAILTAIAPSVYGSTIILELEEGFDEPSSVAIGDLDGDTDLDIAVVCRESLSGQRVVRVVRNTFIETGLVGWVFEVDSLLLGQAPYRVRTTDVDLDGTDDLVALTELAGLVGGFTSGIGTVGPPLASPCFGDLNDDGIVDGGDLAFILSDWGPCSGSCATDFNGNGLVDGGDLAQVLAVWGPCPSNQ